MMTHHDDVVKNIGNAAKVLAPNATFRYNSPGNSLQCLEWMDDQIARPSDAELLIEAEKIANDPSILEP
jgi:hypothetical protein